MSDLVFLEEGHIYEVDGVRLPSVTEILRFLSREAYGEVRGEVLACAAQRGTCIHQATEQLDRIGRAAVPMEYEGYLQAYASFLRSHAVVWWETEQAMYHPKLWYAGTIDRFGMVDGEAALLDIKTSSAITKPLVKAQLNGYEQMRRANGMVPAKRLYCLQLLATGRYRLYPCKMDDTEFMACLALHQTLAKRQKRGVIE